MTINGRNTKKCGYTQSYLLLDFFYQENLILQAFEEHEDVQKIKSLLNIKHFRDAYPRFIPIHVSSNVIHLFRSTHVLNLNSKKYVYEHLIYCLWQFIFLSEGWKDLFYLDIRIKLFITSILNKNLMLC